MGAIIGSVIIGFMLSLGIILIELNNAKTSRDKTIFKECENRISRFILSVLYIIAMTILLGIGAYIVMCLGLIAIGVLLMGAPFTLIFLYMWAVAK